MTKKDWEKITAAKNILELEDKATLVEIKIHHEKHKKHEKKLNILFKNFVYFVLFVVEKYFYYLKLRVLEVYVYLVIEQRNCESTFVTWKVELNDQERLGKNNSSQKYP